MTMARIHVLAIVAGILLPISGPSFAAHQSRHLSSTHSRNAVKEYRGVITSPHDWSHVPAFDPRGNSAYPFGPGSTSLMRTGRMAILIDRSARGCVYPRCAMSALGHKQTYASQQAMSALPPIPTAKADIRNRSCLLYPQERTCAVQ